VPAPAVIPAPIAYVKVVAVKTLVVAVGSCGTHVFSGLTVSHHFDPSGDCGG